MATRHDGDALNPPEPPLPLDPLIACDPSTDIDVLWFIALHAPELHRWLVANPSATPEMLEYIAQAGGPGVGQALSVLLETLEDDRPTQTSGSTVRHEPPAAADRSSIRT